MRLNIPFIKQQLDYTCGPTAMQMVLKYFGKEVPDMTICAMAGTTEARGTTRKGMVNALRLLGLNVHAHHDSSLDEIRFFVDHQIPVIVNYRDFDHNEGHYGVVVGVEGDNILLHDPYKDNFPLVADAINFDARWYGFHSKQFTRWLLAVTDQPLPPYPEHIA